MNELAVRNWLAADNNNPMRKKLSQIFLLDQLCMFIGLYSINISICILNSSMLICNWRFNICIQIKRLFVFSNLLEGNDIFKIVFCIYIVLISFSPKILIFWKRYLYQWDIQIKRKFFTQNQIYNWIVVVSSNGSSFDLILVFLGNIL